MNPPVLRPPRPYFAPAAPKRDDVAGVKLVIPAVTAPDAAVSIGSAPYLVAAMRISAQALWSGAAGTIGPGEPASTATVFRIMSMRNAIGATAAAILAERGTLDWGVDAILPSFADVQALSGFDADGPITRPPKSRATLCQLATHTSGLVYELWDASIARYLEVTSAPPMLSGQFDALHCPLAFDPGQRWQYGPGMDWLGLVIVAIDGRSIDQFCQDEILGTEHRHAK
jgi:methyl acetate hydrolase